MKQSYKSYIIALLAVGALTACSGGDADDDSGGPGGQEQTVDPTRPRVIISPRAEEGAATPDAPLQAGLYMVNYRNGKPDKLLPQNNYVNNMLLTWAGGAWNTTSPIYWSDMDTRADFYAYAPYVADVADPNEMPFSVSTDQRAEEAYTQSDLLWGAVMGQVPTTEGFSLTLAHHLSRLTVAVQADAGLNEGELVPADVSVAIGGTRTSGTINLATGAITLASDQVAQTVLCHSNGDLTYTAILVPQQVPFSNLIQVDWRGNKYTVQNSFLLESGRQYNLTLKLKRTKSGFDIGIDGWDILPEDFGGTIGG